MLDYRLHPKDRRHGGRHVTQARHESAHADAFATALSHRANRLTGEPEVLENGDPAWAVVDLRSGNGSRVGFLIHDAYEQGSREI